VINGVPQKECFAVIDVIVMKTRKRDQLRCALKHGHEGKHYAESELTIFQWERGQLFQTDKEALRNLPKAFGGGGA